MAARKKAAPKKAAAKKAATHSKSYGDIHNRVADAERTQATIRRYAYGTEVDTTLPDEVSLPRSDDGSRIVDADAADTAANVLEVDRLAGILQMKQDGVNTADPEAIVRHAYNMPDVTPPSAGGWLGHYRADRKTEATPEQLSGVVDRRMTELSTGVDFANFRRSSGLRVTSRPEKVFDAMVSSRSHKLPEEKAPWYEGGQIGTTDSGVPIYEEGTSRQVINRVAAAAGQHPDELRRGTAMGSPKSVWSTHKGSFPNVEGASEVMSRAVKQPHKTPEQVATRTGEGDPISGVFLSDRRKAVAEMARGEHSGYRSQIKAAKDKIIPSAKQSNFDLALTSPHHERYGWSPWVAAERAKAFTSDTHDLGVAGIKTPTRKVVNERGREGLKSEAEDWLSRPGGYDISRASALVSLGDRFSEQFGRIRDSDGMGPAQDWARRNASRFALNNAQAGWWVAERGRA